jgi:hypothetical protein
MPAARMNEDYIRETADKILKHGSIRAASKLTGTPRTTLRDVYDRAVNLWPEYYPDRIERPSEQAVFEADPLPSPIASLEDIMSRRRREFERVHAAKQARKLIDVAVNLDGPIGIAHFGDPHVDDPGTNLPLLEKHVAIVNKTEGLLGANVGDQQNLWVGRLAHLYSQQSTSAAESWVLTEWLITSMKWLYLIGGNHDLWAGAGDPLRWLMRTTPGVSEDHGCRLNLKFPNGREVRINARHDFRGHSQWNTAHGPAKAAQMGWRDHILTCGHLHTFGYQVLKDPASGLISHALRVASYKWHDRYADQLGLPDQNVTENVCTIIDPYATEEKCLVHVCFDLEEGADFLTWKRKKWLEQRRVK